MQQNLTLGNIEAYRDWGFAGDYTRGMYLMMQHDKPDDWVLATGETHTVKEFAKIAFDRVGLNWSEYVKTSTKYERPNEVHHLLGDSTKARKELNWTPEVTFEELVHLMVDHDLELAKKEKVLFDKGMLKPTWEYPV